MPPKFSIIPARAYQDIALQPAAFKVLASLGSYADRHGFCYPSQGTLAKKLHVTRQAVNRQIRILVDHGYLKIARRVHPCGAELSCFYQILFDELDACDKDTNERDTKEITPESRYDLESSCYEKTPEISKKASPISKSQFGAEKMPPGDSLDFVLRDKSPETSDVSDPVTFSDADLATPDVAVPEASKVARTTQLTPSLTPVVDGEEMGPVGFKTNPPPHPPGQGIRKSTKRISSSLSTIKTDPDSSFGDEFDPKITSSPDSEEVQDRHPDLRIFLSITHHTPRTWELGSVLLAMRALRMRYPEDSTLRSFLEPFWVRWCTSRRSNGARYNPVNSAWLTDWALSAARGVDASQCQDSGGSSNLGSFTKAMDPAPERPR